ncbi:uncharacterized protein LOC134197813 isoform X2 [Corticium candelabrum]|uniref:uncharacterized protein LOC134197813 isoform X2 n=1 Tax=Corticium candelabrum TaxID=121492 RepID=UPI002E26DE51|nr:uncharacterized protein LOC134197813 isoform X2 [Corticium candelabrum]
MERFSSDSIIQKEGPSEEQCGFRGTIDQIWHLTLYQDMLSPKFSKIMAQKMKWGAISSRFEVTTGVRQGCVMSPVLFNLFMDRIMRETLDKFEGGGIEIAYRTDGGLFMNYRVKPDGHIRSKLPCMPMIWPY